MTEEFRRELALLLIDKALIGVFVLLVAFVVQDRLAERDRLAVQRERVRELTLSVSHVFTETANENRRLMVNAVEELVALLNRYEDRGQVKDSDGRDRLRQISQDLENALNRLARINPELPAKGEPLVQRVQEIHSDLVNRRRDPEALREDAQCLLAGYADLLVDLRTTIVQALEEDRKAVEAVLSEPHNRLAPGRALAPATFP